MAPMTSELEGAQYSLIIHEVLVAMGFSCRGALKEEPQRLAS